MATNTDQGMLRVVLIVLGVLILFPLLMMVFAIPMMGMMGWWWGGGTIENGLSPLWGIGMMLVWLAILVGIGYFLYRGLVGRMDTDSTGDPALEELRIAYARGELSEDEYQKRRERLRTEER
ncbi:SHOCT domain-containing protein [Halorussus salinisoli]|uniref:SHOCT domain-containing protein n=1 Tax=Halorussus salinisoli TaxID=2558242 RepID=UPI0010C234B8|nr:SHOCT domain-containing protein [Halorussus salinisoli]